MTRWDYMPGAKRVKGAPRNKFEHWEQVTLFNWAEMMRQHHPELAFLFAIPNGGYRHSKEAANLKAAGVKAGVPDIFLAYPRKGSQWPHTGHACGLFIEMKRADGGKLEEHQAEWIMRLCDAGYKCAVCHGWVEAAQTICDYLGIDRGEAGVRK